MQQLFVQGIIRDSDYHHQTYASEESQTKESKNAVTQVKGEEGTYNTDTSKYKLPYININYKSK